MEKKEIEKMKQVIVSYYEANKGIKELTKNIINTFEKVKENENLNIDRNRCHLEAFFDDNIRKEISFEYYCINELGMEEACPLCNEILGLINERKRLKKQFGKAKRDIMTLGKKIVEIEHEKQKQNI